MNLIALHPRAILRSIVLLGLAGWAAIFAGLFGSLLVLKLAVWPMVGWFVGQNGDFRGFGFIEAAGAREVLGVWSLPLFAVLSAVLSYLAVSGLRAGLRPLRALARV